MTTPTFTSVAARTVGQYGQVGKLIVDGCRSGARRLARDTNSRYAAFLGKRELPLVTPAVKARLIEIEKRVVALLEEGIVRGSDQAEQVMGTLTDGVTRGIRRVAETAARVETAFGTTAISRVGGFSMPVANASLGLSSLALEGTKRLSARVAGGQARVVVTPAKSRRVVVKKAVRRSKARA